MIDPTSEALISLRDVPALAWMPRARAGKKIALGTVYRWAGRGINGVRLETVRVGGTAYTTEAALRGFFAELTARRGAPTERPAAVLQLDAARAASELKAAGIL